MLRCPGIARIVPEQVDQGLVSRKLGAIEPPHPDPCSAVTIEVGQAIADIRDPAEGFLTLIQQDVASLIVDPDALQSLREGRVFDHLGNEAGVITPAADVLALASGREPTGHEG